MPPSKIPTWLENKSKAAHYPRLKGQIDADAVIIGGGITGLTTAYLLTKAHKKVVVLEKDQIGSGATAYTTAFITQVLDTDASELINLFGLNKARKIWQSHGQAIDLISKIIGQHKIDCEFKKCSDYLYANQPEENKRIIKEAEALVRLGSKVDYQDITDLGFKHYGYAEIKNQAKFHPLKYLTSLAETVASQGGLIFEKTEIRDINSKAPTQIQTDQGQIHARSVIVATHNPFNQPSELFLKKGQYQTYVFEVQLPKGQIPEGIYEDNDNPYHYFRVDPGSKFDRMIIGGEDHREDIPISEQKSFHSLQKYLKQLLGSTDYKIIRKWTGPIVEPIDGLALIGPLSKSPHQFYATGFSGNGMTYGTLSAMILTDRILGQTNPYQRIYDSRRISDIKQLARKGIDYGEELISGAIKNVFQTG